MGFIGRMFGRMSIQYLSDRAFEAGQKGENPPVLIAKTDEVQEYIDDLIEKAYERGRKSVLNKGLNQLGKKFLE